MRAIKPLPANVAEQLQSSVAIISLNQVVIALVSNSLDASASSITIELDYSRANCSVEDDGTGIPVLELGPNGDLAKPYHTSKHVNDSAQHFYGFRGSFLAAVGAISILDVISKTESDPKLSKLIMYQGERLEEAGHGKFVTEQLRSRRHGTIVTVRNLFCNMPVRVKQRPVGDAGRRLRDRAFRGLLRELSALLLACGRDACINVNAVDQSHVWKFRPQRRAERQGPERDTRDPSFDPTRLCSILTHISEARHKWSTWVQTSASSPSIKIRGLISKLPASTRDIQFISLGIHPLPRTEVFGMLYEVINNLIAASDFAHPVVIKDDKFEGRHDTIGPLNGCVEETYDPPAEDVTRQPMYYIRIDISPSIEAQALRPSDIKTKDLNDITGILEAMIIGFLENQKLRPRKKRRRRERSTTPVSNLLDQEVPQRQRQLNDAFSGWSRMKSGLPVRHASKSAINSDPDPDRSTSAADIQDQAGTPSSSDLFRGFDEDAAAQLCRQAEPIVSANGDELISWVDPKSGQRHRINSRTGMLEDEQDIGAPTSSPHFRTGAVPRSRSRITLGKGIVDAPQVSGAAEWADRVLGSWENPVFAPAETAIPAANLDDTDLVRLLDGNQTAGGVFKRFDAAFDRLKMSVESTVTKAQLRRAKVIGQVDTKFILARLNDPITGVEAEASVASLILIDQHAADERIRVEGLLAEACQISLSSRNSEAELGLVAADMSPTTLRLQPPLAFDILERDRTLFEQDVGFFARWGIMYNLRVPAPISVAKSAASRKREGSIGCKLVVHELPSLIAERCRADPNTLRKLLCEEVRKRDELGLAGTVSNAAGDPDGEGRRHAWLNYIHDCPKGMLEMINSRACRSAIMFNDELSLEQCEDLVQNLAETAFPFQCAHGRPSLVPLAGADALAALSGDGEQEDDFSNILKAWMDDGGKGLEEEEEMSIIDTV